MILLFEGCDKAGKSTLISDFRTFYTRDGLIPVLFKNSIKPINSSDFERGKITGIYLGAYQLAQKLGDCIFDRSHITEVVYSHRRGYDALEKFDWKEFEAISPLLKDAAIVYLSAPVEELKKRFDSDKEEMIEKSEISEILNRYNFYLETTSLPIIVLSSTDSREENLEKLLSFVSKL